MRSLPTVLLVLFLALAGTTVVLLDDNSDQGVPGAFLESQQEIAVSTARSVGATANQAVSDLRTASLGASGAVDPLLEALVRDRKWRGVAVLAESGRALVAARGEQVPVQAIPATVTDVTVTSTSAANGEPVLMATTVLPGGRLLAATTALRLPEAEADETLRQSFVLTTLAGKVVGATGPLAEQPEPALAALFTRAAAAAADEPGLLLGQVKEQTQRTLAYARVTPSSNPQGLDLAVVAVADGPVSGSGTGGSGLVPAALLALIALVGFVVVRRVVTTPIRDARADLLRVAAGKLDSDIRPSRTTEIASITAAARVCRDRLVTDPDSARGKPAGRTVPAHLVTAVVAVLVFGWSGGMLATFKSDEVEIPAAVVASVRAQTGKATDALRRSMNDGLADLVTVKDNTKGDGLRAALEGLLANQTRYRSLYLIDRSGKAGDPVGRPPLRTAESPAKTAGLRQQNQTGRVPVLFAEVPVPQGGSLVGEFDLDHLVTLLGHVPGHARVVDTDFRTIVATDGFVAFEEVTASGLRDSAGLAQRGGAVGEAKQGSEGLAIVAAAAVLGGEVGRLGWTVVTEKPATELALPANQARRYAQLVALLAALAALFGYGWLLFSALGPLRRVARAADRLVAGDLKSVIYPQRHDEIGTIASCLEICRQAATQGPERLGEVRRPRGAATDPTQLMKPVDPPSSPRRPVPVPHSSRRRVPARPGSGKGSA